MRVSVAEAREWVREVCNVWLTSQQVRHWARGHGDAAERDDDGEWRVDATAIIDAVQSGTLPRGKPVASREAALVRAVAAAAKRAKRGRPLREDRARELLAFAEGAPVKVRTNANGAPRRGRIDALSENILRECGVTPSRERLYDFVVDC